MSDNKERDEWLKGLKQGDDVLIFESRRHGLFDAIYTKSVIVKITPKGIVKVDAPGKPREFTPHGQERGNSWSQLEEPTQARLDEMKRSALLRDITGHKAAAALHMLTLSEIEAVHPIITEAISRYEAKQVVEAEAEKKRREERQALMAAR